MIPESIKKRREETFFECRQLLIRINGDIQAGSQESLSPDKTHSQTPEDTSWIYNFCDCCQRSDVPNEEMTYIESGQLMCPACLEAFYKAAENPSDPNQ